MARKHLYGCFRFVDKDGKEHFRKPTPKQRKNILIYYLRRRSGRCRRVADIASAFHVSERTMQKLLKELEAENIIRRVPVYGESGVQKASKYIYTGDKSRLTGKEPCIDKIYDPANPMKLRDFDWKGYWTVRDDYLFFHYEEVFGCDGPSRALNERARKNGCTSPEDEFENIQEADIESDLFDEEDEYEYIFPSSRKKK